jgi:hypothetical protein
LTVEGCMLLPQKNGFSQQTNIKRMRHERNEETRVQVQL